tara:strand:+ start:3290 stop:4150 length:861 start_codon:yes stop_codon:yes gene_type:complete
MPTESPIVFPPIAQIVRDFEWLLSCPPLLSSSNSISTDVTQPLPDEKAIGPVRAFLESRASYRVGYYVESLIEVWLRQFPDVEHLKHAVQLQNDRRTVGELDFLFQREGELRHLEVAVKFYLYLGDEETEGSRFPGPNATDNFEKKRDKILGQQIPLGKKYFPDIARGEVVMKGMIFMPPGVTSISDPPEGLNPDHRAGIWIRESEIGWIVESSGAAFGGTLEKPYWLSGLSAEGESVGMPISDLIDRIREHFSEKKHPLLLSLADSDGNEVHRVFVVADHWPQVD